MENKKKKPVGNTFIRTIQEPGREARLAWDDWDMVEKKLLFIAEHPDIQHYDDPQVFDRDKRHGMQSLAKSILGDHIRSTDISDLANFALHMGVEEPVYQYYIDHDLFVKSLRSVAWHYDSVSNLDLVNGLNEISHSDETKDDLLNMLEKLALKHNKWDVLLENAVFMYWLDSKGWYTASFACEYCHETIKGRVKQGHQGLLGICPYCEIRYEMDVQLYGKEMAIKTRSEHVAELVGS